MEAEEEKDMQEEPGKEEELLAPLPWPKLNYCKIAVNCQYRCDLPSKLKKTPKKETESGSECSRNHRRTGNRSHRTHA